MRQLLIALLLAAAAAQAALPASAQDRPPPARRGLLDLAYALGEAHALGQVCDSSSQTWRARMLRLIEVETPDEAFRTRLFNSFNTGYRAAQVRHPRCSAAARSEAARVASRGRDLARVIAAAR